jgi:hypothetical protein
MVPLPWLYGHWKAVVCHGVSIWCCSLSVAKEVNETSSICVGNESQVFFSQLFYRDPVQILQEFSSCPDWMSQTRLLLMCGFMF